MTKIRFSQIIMTIAALSALAAGISGFSNIIDATNATKVVEAWRVIGFFTFAAFFALLAAKPKTDKAVWVVVFLNKLTLTLVGAVFALQSSPAVGVNDVLIFDGGLTLLILVAYKLSRSSQADV